MLTKKIKKYVFAALATAACMLANPDACAQNSRMTLHDAAKNLIWNEKLEREIGFLADSICNGRGTGTGGNVEAGAWIARKFRKAGLLQIDSTWNKSFITANGTIGHNIIGFLPGSAKRHPDKYIIIGAHYDHLGNINGRMFPGADANASGVVAMTSLAEMAAMTKTVGRAYVYNIIFVGFDGKEMDMAGSNALWEMISGRKLVDPVTGKVITKDKVKLMVNIDQIGSSLSPLNKDRKDYLIMLEGTKRDTFNKSLLRASNTRYELNLDLGFTYYDSENFTRLFYRLSDQRIFADHGIPAIMFTSGITMNNNKTWDNVASLDMDVLTKRIYLMYHWLLMMI